MTEPAQLLDVERAIWVCEANYILCRNLHLLRFHETNYAVDFRRIDGHVLFGCKKCEPTTFFFGVVTSRPSPAVTCYSISKPQFNYWNDSTADPLPTTEMLHLLGYNPRWRQQRQT